MEFTDDPVEPGGTVTLEFTVENNTADIPTVAASKTFGMVSDISFTDDLSAVLAGLMAQGLPQTNVCGPGSQIAGTTVLTLTGGSLSPGGSCTFSVVLQVPGDASNGSYRNDTGQLNYMLGGQPGTGNPAADALVVGLQLPVELSRFEAVVDSDRIYLTWSTASETNNAGFAVELSLDDEQYAEHGWVEGRGTTVEAHDYTYTLETQEVGLHFVRLKQVDYDGAFEYSSVVEALIELGTTHRLSSAYPNPFGPSMTFTLTVAAEQRVHVGLYDVMSREVRGIFDGMLTANRAHTFRLDANDLASGMYLYRVTGDNFDESRQVMLVKGSR